MKQKYFMAAVSIIISIILSTFLLIGIINLKIMLPSKILLCSCIISIIIIFNIISYFSKSIKLYNTGVFLSFVLNIILSYYICFYNYNYNFLKEALNNNYYYTTYNIYVKKTNPKYNSIETLAGKNIGLLNDNLINIEEHLNQKVTLQYKTYDSIEDIQIAIEKGEIQGFILEEKSNEFKNSTIEKKVRIIYSNKIKSTK